MRMKFLMLFFSLVLIFHNKLQAQLPGPSNLYTGGRLSNLSFDRIPCDSISDSKSTLTKIMLESGFTKPGEIIITDESAQYRKKFILFSKIKSVKIVYKTYIGGGITYFVRIVTIDDRFQLETANKNLAIKTANIFCCVSDPK